VEAAARGFVVSYTILDSQNPLAAKVAQFYILSMKALPVGSSSVLERSAAFLKFHKSLE
jgi:hypothetical protein